MTEAQTRQFIAALDKVDSALTAIRHEFEEQVRISSERLAEIRAREKQHAEKRDRLTA